MFWWLPDLDDEDEDEDEDDDPDFKRRKPTRGAKAQALSGLRNKPMPDKKLMKQSVGKPKIRRGKKVKDEETVNRKDGDRQDKTEDAVDEEDEEKEEPVPPKKNKKMEEKREKKKTQKG